MLHRRTPYLLAAATTAATAALALVSPAASAAPIPLPHHRAEDGVVGAKAGAGAGAGHGRHGSGSRPGLLGGTVATDTGNVSDLARLTKITKFTKIAKAMKVSDLTGVPDAIGDYGVVDQHGPVGHGGRQAARAHAPGDHLTIAVRNSGSADTDGTFELYCHPGRGNHADAKGACDKLDQMTKWGKDPFAPVPRDAQCTMMYGGPATARVIGIWAGRPVDAEFKRTDGCEISRWSRFEPVLPRTTL